VPAWRNGVSTVTVKAPIDQLFIVSVLGEQSGELTQRLTRDGFQITEINSSGGLFQELQVALLIGLNRQRQDQLLQHIRDCCHRQRRYLPTQFEGSSTLFHSSIIEAEVGGAMIFVVDVERFEQL
jgi:uncharacterized protein YaaQ